MGNSLGLGRKSAKVMKVDGTTFKLKLPVTASDALRGHPGYVLLDATDVKKRGVRSPPIDPQKPLKSKKLYFLVELPKPPEQSSSLCSGRRVQSDLKITAKDRLEGLMLKRRAESDITSLIRVSATAPIEGGSETGEEEAFRMKVRVPKSEMVRLGRESSNSTEAAEKILEFLKKNQLKGMVQDGESMSGPIQPLKKEKKMRFTTEAPEIIKYSG